MRNAYAWFNSKAGPRKGAIVREDGSLVHLDYTNYADTAKVRGCADGVGTVALAPLNGKWSGEARSRVHHGTVWVRDCDTAEEAAAALLSKLGAEVAAETALVADPAAHLERELALHDWYSAMSDDHGYWVAGERHWVLVRDLMTKVPVETVRTLFAKYAPNDFTCPV